MPEFFLRSLGFAHQLDELFMRGAVGDDIDKIDFSPVTIMYCKLIESLLKEYHISIYGNSFESLDTDMRKPENKDEKYKWKDIITLPVTQQQRLTIGSFVFPLYKKWAIDKLVKVTGKKTDEWVEHKKMIMAVKDILNVLPRFSPTFNPLCVILLSVFVPTHKLFSLSEGLQSLYPFTI